MNGKNSRNKMFKINLFALNITKAKPTAPVTIKIQLSIEGLPRDVPFSTKIQIPARYWQNVDDIWCSTDYYNAETVNRRLRDARKKLSDIYDFLILTNEIPTYKKIRKSYNAGHLPQNSTFVNVMNELILEKAEKVTANTLKTYNTRRKAVNECLKFQKMHRMRISEFKYKNFKSLQKWMQKQLNPDKTKRWANNSINKTLVMVNEILKFAVNEEYLRENPVANMNLRYDPPKESEYILPEERQKVIDYRGKAFEKERDVAVFLMFTGLSYTDYLNLKQSHVFTLKSGEIFINKKREKSKIFSTPPLLLPPFYKDAFLVLKKYGTVALLPKLDMSDFNKSLKGFAECIFLNIPFTLSTSTFRETFAGIMENEFMLEDRIIARMLGHANTRQIRTYSTVAPARIMHDIRAAKTPLNVDYIKPFVK
jgi:integrase